jgi:hypothetical protein
MPIVETAWMARAAQLCRSGKKQYLVELKYVGDRALDSDTIAMNWSESPGHMFKVARGVYVPIPIIIPSRPREIVPVLTPSKMGSVRCLATDEGLLQGKVAVDTQAAIDAGRKAGLEIP